ncbi:group 1 glycosyl transferase [Candidatus Poribacteria bacterium]|nr:group 1 glycosyl transferase [Candidatus Poribacteria bacterium]
MANYWAEQGKQIQVITFEDVNIPQFFSLRPEITYTPLSLTKRSDSLIGLIVRSIRRILAIRHAIKSHHSETVISFMTHTNILTIFSCLNIKAKLIISERCDPSSLRISKVFQFLRWGTYSYCDSLVVQTSEIYKFFSGNIQDIHVIPNPISLPRTFKKPSDRPQKQKKIVAMGRLTYQKGFDLLIKAFAQIHCKYQDWELIIWGEGEGRMGLEHLRNNLGLEGRVFICGQTSEPFDELSKADIFVLSSRFEGFPNVLCEAMACGIATISFDCPTGPRDIIRNELDGILVPPEDIDSLSEAMERLVSNEFERESIARRTPEILDRYGIENIMGMWEKII